MNEFYSAMAILYQLYAVEIDENEFEEIALHAWRLIGNSFYNTYVHKDTIVNYEVMLPCNFILGESKIEAVQLYNEDATFTSNTSHETLRNSIIEENSEYRNVSTEFLYESGKYIDYEQDVDRLRFKITGVGVKIVYKGLLLDNNGLPYISNKEMSAIARYVAYIKTFKQAMATRDKFLLDTANLHKQNWDKECSNARTPDSLTQNDMDDIMNAMTSWDRKRYGLSYKPVRK